ncbi:SUMF1/EgtB/PvdO family nonheme iron enzyme [Polyangium spumosum]|nr:SUMF1/EgtB/PvdO family nonheme iron enzyme [Polyangium spumosum]
MKADELHDPPMPLDPPRPDSVPPLASTLVEAPSAPRPGRRVMGEAALVISALATAATLVLSVTIPPERRLEARRLAALVPAPPPPRTLAPDDEDEEPGTLAEQRARLFERMREDLGLSEMQIDAVRAVFDASPVLGQGNPAISRHPMSRSECRRLRIEAGITEANVPACGGPSMVPLYDPSSGQTAADARVCMDQLEFPNVPCEYPVVHVRASEAAALCRAVGKRICDTHEWEGACAGAVRAPEVEYEWGRPRDEATWYHNLEREKVWAYGAVKNHALCGTASSRTPGCPGGGYDHCGSNTYPAGAFPACVSPLGVFDLHGNAAEHMNMPTLPGELAARGGLGFTEMKGSWFVFSTIEAHEDDCRWRAPSWHETRLTSESSHWNYHLGFRCCKDL